MRCRLDSPRRLVRDARAERCAGPQRAQEAAGRLHDLLQGAGGLSRFELAAHAAHQDHREMVKEENPGIGFGEIGKKLGEKWSAVDEKTTKVRLAHD